MTRDNIRRITKLDYIAVHPAISPKALPLIAGRFTPFQYFLLAGTTFDALKKVKLSLCLTNKALRLEGVCGSGCIDPRFLDLGTSYR
jgi:hypothetical protein